MTLAGKWTASPCQPSTWKLASGTRELHQRRDNTITTNTTTVQSPDYIQSTHNHRHHHHDIISRPYLRIGLPSPSLPARQHNLISSA
jgi:hypothetical protein